MSGPKTIGGPWTADNPLPVVEVTNTPPNVRHWYPPTVDDPLPVYIVTGARVATFPAEPAPIEDAPHDGRVYARRNGEWVPIGVQQD
jgi:hypothetical protein